MFPELSDIPDFSGKMQFAKRLLNLETSFENIGFSLIIELFKVIRDILQEESIILPLSRHGVDIICKPLNWDGYVTMASFINEAWEEGFWQKLEKIKW